MEWDPARTGTRVEELLGATSGPVVIVAPFVKVSALRRLCALIDSPLTLYTRWMPHEVAAGVSDLEAFDVVQGLGGQLRLHPRLHAKVYSRGSKALVGSANATLTGLGFRDPAGIELLVPVALPSTPITDLLNYLERTTPIATERDRQAVAERAAQVDLARMYTRTADDERYAHDVEASPQIQFRDPSVAWDYYRYSAQYNQELVKQLFRSLMGLGVPPWINDRREFEAAVGASMRQGVHGRVLKECAHLPAYSAIGLYREILSDAGVHLPEARADESWRTFCYWAQRFVPEIRLHPSQVGF